MFCSRAHSLVEIVLLLVCFFVFACRHSRRNDHRLLESREGCPGFEATQSNRCDNPLGVLQKVGRWEQSEVRLRPLRVCEVCLRRLHRQRVDFRSSRPSEDSERLHVPPISCRQTSNVQPPGGLRGAVCRSMCPSPTSGTLSISCHTWKRPTGSCRTHTPFKSRSSAVASRSSLLVDTWSAIWPNTYSARWRRPRRRKRPWLRSVGTFFKTQRRVRTLEPILGTRSSGSRGPTNSTTSRTSSGRRAVRTIDRHSLCKSQGPEFGRALYQGLKWTFIPLTRLSSNFQSSHTPSRRH